MNVIPPCGCEHVAHEEQPCAEPSRMHRRAMYVGRVCDPCADGHLREVMIHDRVCTAHAIGCAVENIRDGAESEDKVVRAWAGIADPVAEGKEYLRDGTASCRCGYIDGHSQLERQVRLGMDALTLRLWL